MKNIVILISLSFLVSSCATIFSKSADTVTFKTAPEGATVYLDGNEIGKTPLTKSIQRRMAAHKVTFKKEGFKSQTFTLKKSLTGAAFFNCTSILSWGTDALTGKMFEYKPNSYFVDLENERTGRVSEESLKYLLVNHSDVIKDLSKKGGEHSKNLAKMLVIQHEKIIQWSSDNISEVVELDPIDLHLELSMI